MKKICGMNGFGRFGIHFLRYYLINHSKKNIFSIKYINDDKLTFKKIKELIVNDEYINLSSFDYKFKKSSIILFNKSKDPLEIYFTNKSLKKISWLNKIDYYLECSGNKVEYLNFIKNKFENIEKIIISATSNTSDQTLVYGYNNDKYKLKSKTISYGSCTVNAFVPLANFINKKFKIQDCDVNVIHNLPKYKLHNETNIELRRKYCTLSSSGIKLLSFLNKNNFNVNYTLVPYTGPSIMDIRFRLSKKPISLRDTFKKIKSNLKNLYSYDLNDKGSNNYKFINNNLKLILNESSQKGKSLYLFGYFDNENSVVRYYDLIKYIISENKKRNVKKM